MPAPTTDRPPRPTDSPRLAGPPRPGVAHRPIPSRVVIRRRRIVVALLAAAVVVAVVTVVLLGRGAIERNVGLPGTGLPPIGLGTPSAEEGYIETGESVSPFDESSPAIAKLDPALRSAVQEAARAAEADGIPVVVTSGWRSHEYQRWLYDTAVKNKGEDYARDFVAVPGTSSHETGEAVDIGYTDADDWFNRHGDAYGLCQIYTNEIWHFELATTPGGECPAQLEGAEAR